MTFHDACFIGFVLSVACLCILTIWNWMPPWKAGRDTAAEDAVRETAEVLSDPEAMRMLAESEKDVQAGRVYDQADVERELTVGDDVR